MRFLCLPCRKTVEITADQRGTMPAKRGGRSNNAGFCRSMRSKNWGSNPPGPNMKPRDSKEPRGFFFAGSKAGRNARLASHRKPIGVQAAPPLAWFPPHRPPVVNLRVSVEAMWLEAENKSVPFFPRVPFFPTESS